MIDIKDIQGSIIYSTDINKGAKRKLSLMKEDYVMLPFSLDEPLSFGLGSYAEIDGVRFEVTDLQKPTLNATTGAYDYELRLDAYYWKWKNKVFKFTLEVGGQEALWSLTASLDVHLGILLRNLKALGYTYGGVEFEFSIDATVENKAMSLVYENMNMIDALSAMAESWGCEWWVTDNVINFGRCEYGTAVDFEIGKNVAEMSRSESQSSYATRLYVFGSTKNIPSSYRPVDESVVVNGVVQRRLMLPEGTLYIDAYENMSEEEAVEEVVILEDIYPKTEGNISSVSTYDDTVENEDDTTTTETFYRFTDSGFTFSEDYVLEGEELKVSFTSGTLNGMEFGVVFNPKGAAEKNEDGTWNSEAQLYEIVANEDYGRKLPDATLYPKAGDTYVLSGWDSTKIADLGLVSNAEQELLTEGLKISEKRKIDPNTYNCKMFSDYMYGLDEDGNQDETYSKHFELGDKVNLVNPAYFDNGRQSRIIGYEYNLDYTFDNPVYTVGETASYSRIGELENKIDALTLAGQTYTGGSGSGVYVIGTNDLTKATNRNVYSALRSDANYLSKTKDDRSKGTVASDKGFEVGKFITGMIGGSGAKIFQDENKKTILEIDKIHGREELIVPKITYNTIEVVAGEMAQTFAYGTIKSVDKEKQIIVLDLLEDEYGTVADNDICRGIFHFIEEENQSEYGVDHNGFHKYSGFSTAYFDTYFTEEDLALNGKGYMQFHYNLQSGTSVHPCAAMKFFGYGNFFKHDRQSITYFTREYTRRLKDVSAYPITTANIAMQQGNLKDLKIGDLDLSGYSSYQENVYMTGSFIKFTPQQEDDLKGDSAYSATLSSYVGSIRVNDKGEIVEERHVEQELEGGEYYLRTTVQAMKGETELFYSSTMGEGSFGVSFNPVGCIAQLINGTIFVTDFNEGIENAYIDIDVSCEGMVTYTFTFEIKLVKDGASGFTSLVFTRTNDTPDTPKGGSYDNPIPDAELSGREWIDGVPSGKEQVWMSSCTFVSNGTYPDDAAWSDPKPLTDTADFEVIYSPMEEPNPIPDGFSKDGIDLNDEWEASANSVHWYDEPYQWNVDGNEYNDKPAMWMATNTCKNGEWEGWKTLKILGESSFVKNVFTRSNTEPNKPEGGDYKNPDPINSDIWKDGIPDGEHKVWMSYRTYTTDGKYPQTDWSEPKPLTDTADFEVVYHDALENQNEEPVPPTNKDEIADEWTPDNGWTDDPTEDSMWMASIIKRNGEWGDWKVVRIKGEDGESALVLQSSTKVVTRNGFGTYVPSNARVRAVRAGVEESTHMAMFGIKDGACVDSNGNTINQSIHVNHGATWDLVLNAYSVANFDAITFRCYIENKTSYSYDATVDVPLDEETITFTGDGHSGAMPRNRGQFSLGANYFYNDEYRDFVWTTNGQVYMRNGYGDAYSANGELEDTDGTKKKGGIVGIDVSDSTYWTIADRSTLMAIDTALIEGAYIGGFVIQNQRMTSQNSNSHTLILDGVNGYFKCVNADIDGNLNVGSLRMKTRQSDGSLDGYSLGLGGYLFELPTLTAGQNVELKVLYPWIESRVPASALSVYVKSGDNAEIVVPDTENVWAKTDTTALLKPNILYTLFGFCSNTGYTMWYIGGSYGSTDSLPINVSVDKVVYQGSTNPVSGGAVYTALQNKIQKVSSKDEAMNGDSDVLYLITI